MKTITRGGGVHPDAMAYDVAERKGIGHPDSLADLVADAFSRGTRPSAWRCSARSRITGSTRSPW
jgi:S-adenosylmethionine synthetase